jgi:uncharacterized protein
MHAMRRFEAAGFPYGVRMTVTRDQIPRVPESVAFVCEHFSPDALQVEPAYQLGRWSDQPSAETEEFIAAYREAQRIAAGHGREISYSAARLDVLTNHFCGITQDSFCLTPDGNVSACYEAFSESNPWARVFHYGEPQGEGYRFDLDVLSHLRGQSVEHRAHCAGCFAKWHCAGDCAYKARQASNGGLFRGDDRCAITRALSLDQILERIARSGGVVWAPDREDAGTGPAG